jgi:hypothetical protein
MPDTYRTESALLTTLYQDGQASNSITAQDMRDLIVSLVHKELLSTKGSLVSASAANVAAELLAGDDFSALLAASGETTGLQWGRLYGNFPTLASNAWYSGLSTTGRGTSAGTLNRMFAYSFTLSRTTTIASMGVEVTAGGTAGALIRFGVYGDNGSHFPQALIQEVTSVSPVDATVVQVHVRTPPAALTLDPGQYWFAVVQQVAVSTMRVFNSYVPINMPHSVNAATFSPAAPIIGWYQDAISGALPDPFGASVNGAAGSSFIPVIGVKAA